MMFTSISHVVAATSKIQDVNQIRAVYLPGMLGSFAFVQVITILNVDLATEEVAIEVPSQPCRSGSCTQLSQ